MNFEEKIRKKDQYIHDQGQYNEPKLVSLISLFFHCQPVALNVWVCPFVLMCVRALDSVKDFG